MCVPCIVSFIDWFWDPVNTQGHWSEVWQPIHRYANKTTFWSIFIIYMSVPISCIWLKNWSSELLLNLCYETRWCEHKVIIITSWCEGLWCDEQRTWCHWWPGGGHSRWKGVWAETRIPKVFLSQVWGCVAIMTPFFQASRRSLAHQFTVNVPLSCPLFSIFRKFLHFQPWFGQNSSSLDLALHELDCLWYPLTIYSLPNKTLKYALSCTHLYCHIFSHKL